MSSSGATRAATLFENTPLSTKGLGHEDANTFNNHIDVASGIYGVKMLRLKLAELGLQRVSPTLALTRTCTFTNRVRV